MVHFFPFIIPVLGGRSHSVFFFDKVHIYILDTIMPHLKSPPRFVSIPAKLKSGLF
jgi:hypothetical protein